MSHRKWRETKEQPSRVRSGRQISYRSDRIVVFIILDDDNGKGAICLSEREEAEMRGQRCRTAEAKVRPRARARRFNNKE